jgi:hypothetical protein
MVKVISARTHAHTHTRTHAHTHTRTHAHTHTRTHRKVRTYNRAQILNPTLLIDLYELYVTGRWQDHRWNK